MSSNNNLFFVHDVLYENRNCNQEGFSVLFCGGRDKNDKFLNRVLEVKMPSFEVIEFPSMVKPRFGSGYVVVDSDIIAVGGDQSFNKELKNYNETVEIYSYKRKSRQKPNIQIEEKICYCCCCGFKNKLFIIGGFIKSSNKTQKVK